MTYIVLFGILWFTLVILWFGIKLGSALQEFSDNMEKCFSSLEKAVNNPSGPPEREE